METEGVRFCPRRAGVEHGFNNDTTPRFDAKAAALAWRRTLAFFAQNLKTPCRCGPQRLH